MTKLRHVLPLAATIVGLVACQDAREPGVLPETPLTVGSARPAPVVPLEIVGLATQADFDALELSVLQRRRATTVIALYEALAVGAQPAVRPPDALLLQRLARLMIDTRGQQRELARGLELARRLSEEAPDSPHTRYLAGYIKRKLLASEGGARALALNDMNQDAARQLLADWRGVLEIAPDYVGPEGHDAAQLREDIARLERGLAQQGKAAPSAAPAATSRQAGPLEAAALGELRAFEDARDVERKLLCRDRRTGERMGGASAAEARMDLGCALVEGDLDLGLAALGRLVAAGGPDAPCRWVPRLQTIVPASRQASFDAAIAALPLRDCAP